MLNRKYRYLIALAKERHYGRAAALCNISPSTLSAAIADLEHELGFAVVDRGKRYGGLTAEGELLVQTAQNIEQTLHAMQQELSQRQGKLVGQLKIGAIPAALAPVAFLSKLFSQAHPAVTLEILSLSTGEILQQLDAFEIDAGIVYEDPALRHTLVLTPLWQESHVLVTPKIARFKGKRQVSWRDAATLNLCLLSANMKNRQLIDRTFNEIGCPMVPQLSTNSIISMLAHVSTGHWSGILPKSTIDMLGAPQDTVVLPLTLPERTWNIELATRKHGTLSPILSALTGIAVQLHEMFDKNEQSFNKIHFL